MSRPNPPPRWLTGAALIFWGALTGRPALGVGLAVVVEAAHWARMRWEFDAAGQRRAARLSLLLMLLTAVGLWFGDAPYMAVPRLLGWLPLLLLPLEFAQIYGTRREMDLRAFTLVPRGGAAPRIPPDSLSLRPFHFGWIYLAAVLVAATPMWKMPDSRLHLPGLALFIGWALAATRRCHWLHAALVMVPVLAMGVAGQWLLGEAADWVNRGILRASDYDPGPSHFRTAIGRMGEIKQSRTIMWRLTVPAGTEVPPLLRTRGYNRYRSGLWSNCPPKDPQRREESRVNQTASLIDDDFQPLGSVPLTDGRPCFYLRNLPAAEIAAWRGPTCRLRGTVPDNNWPVPLPDSAIGLVDFKVQSFEQNSLASVTINPLDSPVVAGEIRWGDTGRRETPPWAESDLMVDPNDRAAVRQTLAALELSPEQPLAAKLAAVKHHFSSFQYTLYNTIQAPAVGTSAGTSAISQFLTTARRGHCEYFATAACLILREAGIPSRYAIGFSVAEHARDRDEWVIRGSHAHAWVRVWDEARGGWIDFDPTPPDWLAEESDGMAWYQGLLDTLHRSKEDFNLWRDQPGNSAKISAVMLGGGGLGLGVILVRLWRGRRFVPKPLRGSPAGADGPRTPLHDLARAAARCLPERAPGEPYAAWLARLEPILTDPAPLHEALARHQQLRFDPAADGTPDARLAELTKILRKAIRGRR